jgi:hypothetical protein
MAVGEVQIIADRNAPVGAEAMQLLGDEAAEAIEGDHDVSILHQFEERAASTPMYGNPI